MNNIRFKCTDETVCSLYNLFDKVVLGNENLIEVLKDEGDLSVNKNFLNREYIRYSSRQNSASEDIEEGTIKSLNAKGIFKDDKDSIVYDLFMLNEICLSSAYFYKKDDICRSSEDYGIVGDSKHYSNSQIIHSPRSTYRFNEICEVREEYKNYVSNGYSKIDLPFNIFKSILSNKDYKDFFSGQINKGNTVNRLLEKNGMVFCRNQAIGYEGIEKLKGVESDFYNELLECVVGLGRPINSVYFYSDLNWSCILYKKSKVKGEYEIVIK